MKIAVISDLHVGQGARAKDLCPPNLNSSAAEDGFRTRFLTFLKEQNIGCDYLVLPGDVSHVAKPEEFQLASEFVHQISNVLNVEASRIIFVPGNHDVDWSVLRAEDPTGFRQTQRYDPLNHKDWIFETIMSKGQPSLLIDPYFCFWEFNDLLAVGYNSSWKDAPADAVHHGAISTEHLHKLGDQLSAMGDDSRSRLRVFLVHHHPLQYSDPVDDPPDFSAMTNANNLLALLRQHNFDLLIHGHKHKPNFETQIVNASSPLAILCAGSLSIQLDTRWAGRVNNQFHLIHVDGRDASLSVYGRVESWAYICGDGWVPSKPHNGIRYQEPFGTYLVPEELRKTLRPILIERFKQAEYIEWKTIVLLSPNLKYLSPDRTLQVLDSLCGEVNFKRYGDLPDELVLVRL